MITIDGIQISDYSTKDTGASVIVTVAVKHNPALSSINVNDTVTLAGNLDGVYTYDGADKYGQKCFSSL